MKNVIFEYVLTKIITQCPKCGNKLQINGAIRYVHCSCGCEIVLPEYDGTLHLVGIAKEKNK